ncbi:hypothetical protein ColKHC_13026 [Colletotrichum higginsianum]|nr:hypothetical protein ColKHC_13026 [Colletotrichum higginsianum]
MDIEVHAFYPPSDRNLYISAAADAIASTEEGQPEADTGAHSGAENRGEDPRASRSGPTTSQRKQGSCWQHSIFSGRYAEKSVGGISDR